MTLHFGLTQEHGNTQYAPLAALAALYQAHHTLDPLAGVTIPMKTRQFRPVDKLIQVLFSILAGCNTLAEVNTKLKSEAAWATVWGWAGFADQSTLSRTLDALSLKQVDQLRHSSTSIWRSLSQTRRHNWHGYLWLDFDLSGLPCSARAEASQKGYFSEKKRDGTAVGAGQRHPLW